MWRGLWVKEERKTHTLDGSGEGAHYDHVVQLERLVPAMRELATEDLLLLVGELRETLERQRVLRDEGTLAEVFLEVFETVLAREAGSVGHELVLRDALERVGEACVDVIADGVDMAHRRHFFVFVRHRGWMGARLWSMPGGVWGRRGVRDEDEDGGKERVREGRGGGDGRE